MAPKFGTSGLRGLATEMTSDVVRTHVAAFLRACPFGTGLFVGLDLRDSSPRIAQDVIETARAMGVDVTDCGAVPTPALALAAMTQNAAAIMVTGSHIPQDRNGLKFYTPTGEITKSEERAILGACERTRPAPKAGTLSQQDLGPGFVARYVAAFGPTALAKRRIGVWSHSAVGRDLLIETLSALGAEVMEFGRSDHFVPVDTEAVSDGDRDFLKEQANLIGVDAIVSTDGDGDRPLVTDQAGHLIAGDVIGQITARLLGAKVVVTPVSSNTGVEKSGAFRQVIRTQIGSPHVIEGMNAAQGKVVGYEANGGFVLGFDAQGPAGRLRPLMTRDSHLPIIGALVAAGDQGLAARAAAEPARFTAATRVQDVPSDVSRTILARLCDDDEARTAFLAQIGHGQLHDTDLTDGLRCTLDSGRIVHLRPSGNAPELRIYSEAESFDIAREMVAMTQDLLANLIDQNKM